MMVSKWVIPGLCLVFAAAVACSGSSTGGGSGSGGSGTGATGGSAGSTGGTVGTAGSGGGTAGTGTGATSGSGGEPAIDRSCAAPSDCVVGVRAGRCCGDCEQALSVKFVDAQPCYIRAGTKPAVPQACVEGDCENKACPDVECLPLVGLDCVEGMCVGFAEGEGCDPNNHPDETAGCACEVDKQCTCRIFTGAGYEEGKAPSTCDPKTNRCAECFYF